jgi:hypothetical protein
LENNSILKEAIYDENQEYFKIEAICENVYRKP